MFSTYYTENNRFELIQVFSAILTDKDPFFSDIDDIEIDKYFSELCIGLLFCDAYKSGKKKHQLKT